MKEERIQPQAAVVERYKKQVPLAGNRGAADEAVRTFFSRFIFKGGGETSVQQEGWRGGEGESVVIRAGFLIAWQQEQEKCVLSCVTRTEEKNRIEEQSLPPFQLSSMFWSKAA